MMDGKEPPHPDSRSKRVMREYICYQNYGRHPGMNLLAGLQALVKAGYFSASTGGFGRFGRRPRGNLTWLLIFNRMPTASKLTSSPEPP